MIDATTLRNWALALTACAAVAVPSVNLVRNLIAQEARAQAQSEVAGIARQVEQIKDLARRNEDREQLKLCLEFYYPDDAPDVRAQKCTAESNARWRLWEWEDCEEATPGKCGERPSG